MTIEGTDMDPTLHAHEMVIVENEGTQPIPLRYAGQRYVLQPGKPIPVPYLAMVLWFGNPAAVDMSRDDPSRRHRTKECERMSCKWGVGFDAWYQDPDLLSPGTRPQTSQMFAGEVANDRQVHVEDYTMEQILGRAVYRNPRLPRVKVTTYDGKRIVTVIDDPEGAFISPGAGEDTKSTQDRLLAELETLRQTQHLALAALRDVNPEVAEKMAVQLAVRPDTPTSDSGVPLWPSTSHPSEGDASTSPSTSPSSSLDAVLGDDSGLTNALEKEPTPRPRTAPRSKS